MFNIMKKALNLEEEDGGTGNADNCTPSGRLLSQSKIENSSAREERSVSPISRFRYVEVDDDDQEECIVKSPNRQDPVLLFSESMPYDSKFNDKGVIHGTSYFSVDRRDEEDEEHPLQYFFRPLDKSGSWNERLTREIEAARKAASISVTADRSHIEDHTRNLNKSSQQMIERLKEALQNPTTRQKLKSAKKLQKLEESNTSSPNAVETSMSERTSSLFRLRQFIIEEDETGEGVSVQTNLSSYEDERQRCRSKKTCSPESVVRTEGQSEISRILSNNCDECKCLISDEQYEGKDEQSARLPAACIAGQNVNENKAAVSHLDRTVDESCITHNDGIVMGYTPGAGSLTKVLSATESDVDSLDGLPSNLQTKWLMGESPKEQMLASLDGIQTLSTLSKQPTTVEFDCLPSPLQISEPVEATFAGDELDEKEKTSETKTIFDVWPMNMLCGKDTENIAEGEGEQRNTWKEHADALALLDCANIIYQEDRIPVTAPAVQTSLIRVASEPVQMSYADTILAAEVDPRMQDWIVSQFRLPGKPPKDGSYYLGKSRTVIVHEIARGAWTWCTEWSPDGNLLAVATENHHLAVIDTTDSTVWRVKHDQRIKGAVRNHTTHSVRAIAWGHKYIAIGGTGNAVSILAPTEPYPVLHTITGTGFVGTLDWREKSNILVYGSRLDKVTIARISSTDEDSLIHGWKQTESKILHTIDLKHWANSVKFCPGGNFLAIGDAGGVISVHSFTKAPKGQFDSSVVAWFPRKDSILSVEWSPDGKWLYAGGEDRCVTVIDTTFWEIVHTKGRERWVQCISSSHSGSHLAVGGVSSEISLLDTKNGWDSVMGIELKGLVPLSATWHPRDQYLALTGQNNSILVVETTNARHVKGHHLYSISPIVAIDFSPDGRMAIIGNQVGVVTFFSLSGTTFITAYELIVTLNRSLCTRWSLNGTFAVIGGKDAVIIVGRKKMRRHEKKAPPEMSGFSVRKVIRELGETNAISIDYRSQYVAVSGNCTRILDARADFAPVREWNNGPYYANAWSPDGRWFAMIGESKLLTIYDTSEERPERWRPIFSMKCDFIGLSLAWGPSVVGGLLYLAYGGMSNEISIMEIRTREGTWESVLRIPRDGSINALDWSTDGLLAAAIGNGTVGIIDLGYLQSGVAVNEMDYNWQRQALTCFTEIRRNRGRNSMKCIRWLPAAPGSDHLLAVGGTDGELEIIDLTERRRCRGYVRGF